MHKRVPALEYSMVFITSYSDTKIRIQDVLKLCLLISALRKIIASFSLFVLVEFSLLFTTLANCAGV